MQFQKVQISTIMKTLFGQHSTVYHRTHSDQNTAMELLDFTIQILPRLQPTRWKILVLMGLDILPAIV